MGLSLVVGPAHAGKVARLLVGYLGAIDRDPWLIVPARGDVERVEHDLLSRAGVLLAGRIGTFDDLFEEIAAGSETSLRDAPPPVRDLMVGRAIAGVSLGRLASSGTTSGFADSLLAALGELNSALVGPEQLNGDLALLHAAYASELTRAGLRDRDGLKADAIERLRSDLDAWRGDRPVFAYGFEDLTAAEWSLLEALAARAEVHVSIPYEPARAAFASLGVTVTDLAGLAAGQIEELPARDAATISPPLHHLERGLFEDAPGPAPQLDGSLRFLEGAGTRGTLELLAETISGLIRRGTPPERIGVVCDSVERWRTALDATFGALGVPVAVEVRPRFDRTPFGAALLALLRVAWLGGERDDLFEFLRSPFAGLQRRSVDFVEGRLRGRAVSAAERVEEEGDKLRGAPVAQLVALRAAPSPVAGAKALARSMATAGFGLESPPTGDDARLDLAAYQAAVEVLDHLHAYEAAASALEPVEIIAALERSTVRAVGAGEPGRVAVVDLPHARTRTFDAVFILGLEEGSLPRRGRESPFLDDAQRTALGSRLARPDGVSRERYLFYTACTRATQRLTLVREAASDEGQPREASPFWHEVTRLFPTADVARWTRSRPLSALTWPLEAAPTERERLRALAQLSVADGDGAAALAAANDWGRKLERAGSAFHRETKLRNPVVLEWLAARTTFGVTELEVFSDCSQRWLVERQIDPKSMDAEADAMLRGQVAHQALQKFYGGLQKELGGVERVTEETFDRAFVFLESCLDGALASWVRFDATDVQRAELRHSLLRDLEGFLRDEASSKLTFVPRKLEVSFGSERSAPELQRGLDLGDGIRLSGKIDRIDQDPFGAEGIVQDYKSGKTAHSAVEIDREARLQIPLYMLVLRDLVGIEPLGGVYRALSGKRLRRGMLRAESRDDLPGFAANDYLDEETFWAQTETARTRASESAQRIRSGDVLHDPRDGECPSWCDAWPICRIEHA
ncbi:MAG: PD-(D/E)XK nuclease family protein [Gaiellaceae bacterium]